MSIPRTFRGARSRPFAGGRSLRVWKIPPLTYPLVHDHNYHRRHRHLYLPKDWTTMHLKIAYQVNKT